MRLTDQNIPAELYRAYERSLGFALETKEGSGIYSIRKRPPRRLPHMRTNSGNSPSAAQKKVRAAFKKCVDCFNASPREGGVEPPAIGYRSKEWWYEQASAATYPPYIGEDFHTWAGDAAVPYEFRDSSFILREANWFLKTDEPAFIDFYDEMKIKYGYPWSNINSPDQIVTKMNQIVCDEIKYDLEVGADYCLTPGQTAEARAGVCDEQSVLHYALTWKALKELEWTDNQINARLGCIINKQSGQGHIYNWWKANNGRTRIVENTYDPGQSPKVIGGMAYWSVDKPEFLLQRFDKSGHWEPFFTANGVIMPLWYYDYFIQQSWQTFFNNEIPDWCCVKVTGDSYTSQQHPYNNYGWNTIVGCKNNPGDYAYGYFQNPTAKPTYLHLYMSLNAYPPFTFKVYKTVGEWNEDTITWSNQPWQGEYLSTFTQPSFTVGWQKIEVKGNNSVLIKKVDGSTFHPRCLSSENADATKHPYFT